MLTIPHNIEFVTKCKILGRTKASDNTLGDSVNERLNKATYASAQIKKTHLQQISRR